MEGKKQDFLHIKEWGKVYPIFYLDFRESLRWLVTQLTRPNGLDPDPFIVVKIFELVKQLTEKEHEHLNTFIAKMEKFCVKHINRFFNRLHSSTYTYIPGRKDNLHRHREWNIKRDKHLKRMLGYKLYVFETFDFGKYNWIDELISDQDDIECIYISVYDLEYKQVEDSDDEEDDDVIYIFYRKWPFVRAKIIVERH